MDKTCVVVLDVGKTLAKLSLWDRAGRLLGRRTRRNDRIDAGNYAALDVFGVESWLATMLGEFNRIGRIGAVIPVGHGAGAALVRDGRLTMLPLDYEVPLPADARRRYDADRDRFCDTGSPALPDGLNLGAQLHWLQEMHPEAFSAGTMILPWAQYWSWLLSGIGASEVSSLGCHTDLWLPHLARPSALADTRGWAAMLAPLRKAGDILGTITPAWRARTGLSRDVRIHCGLHDSNAALLAARGFAEIAGHEATVLSTGTWFVAMRSPAAGAVVGLPEGRDCLVNVDVSGVAVPSSRFMGGREIELLTGAYTQRIDLEADQPALVAAVPAVLTAGSMVLPTMVPGFGPFPHGRGRWSAMPTGATECCTAVALYAALVADAALALIGSRERLLIEGRFAQAEVFVRGLATLRPETAVYTADVRADVSFGALRQIEPALKTPGELLRVAPLAANLDAYRAKWRREGGRTEPEP